jgi:predicted GNAT family N-acyltransferase
MPVTSVVTWVHATRENEVKFGVACMAMDWRLQGGICDFLLYAGHWSPNMLRSAGFRTRTVKSHLRYRTVKTMEDYSEVLRLRRTAYVGAGKRPETTTPEDMAAPLDGISRILTARHHGQLVGSMTFTFPPSEDTLLDSESGFPSRKYPVRLPPKANLIEVSRLCVHPDYRGTDLLQGLFEHGLKHFLMSDRHWLLTSATADLVPMYQEIGFTRLKAAYRHPLLGNKEHTLLIAHRSAFLWGFGIGVLTWNSVFGDLVRHLVENRLIRLPGWVRAIIRTKLLLRPLARLRSDAKARKAFRKHLESMKRRRLSEPGSPRREAVPTGPDGSPPAQGISEGLENSLYRSVEIDVPAPRDRAA